METTEKTLLNSDAKNILVNLINFTESKIPKLLDGLKNISENEVCKNIPEIVKNNFNLGNNNDSLGVQQKSNNKNRIKLN